MSLHPAAAKTTPGFLSRLLMLFVPTMMVIITAFLMPNAQVLPTEQERTLIRQFDVDIHDLDKRAVARFNAMFVSTNILQATTDFISGSSYKVPYKPGQVYRMDWINQFWRIIYKAVWRFYALANLFAFVLFFLCAPAFIDGYTTRLRKRYEFESQSPTQYASSFNLLTVVIGLFISIPFLPVTLNMGIILSIMCAGLIGSWLIAGSMKVRS